MYHQTEKLDLMSNKYEIISIIVAGALFLTGSYFDDPNRLYQPTILALSRETALQVNPNIGYLADAKVPADAHCSFNGHLSEAPFLDKAELIDPQYGRHCVALSVRNNMAREVYLYIDQRRGPTVQPGEWGQMTVPTGAVPSYYRFCVNAKDGGEDLDIDFRIEQW